MNKETIRSSEDFFKIHPVSFDHDGVMADTRTLVIDKVNERFGTDYIAHDIRSWHWVYEEALRQGMQDTEAKKFENELWYGETLLEADPMPGAVELRKWFNERGLYAPTVSSRDSDLYDITLEWYNVHMPFVRKEQIIINPGKEMRGDWFKVYALQNISKSAIHFEDSVEHARKILDYTNASLILFSQSRVLDSYDRNRLFRVYSEDFSQPNLVSTMQDFLEYVDFPNVAQY